MIPTPEEIANGFPMDKERPFLAQNIVIFSIQKRDKQVLALLNKIRKEYCICHRGDCPACKLSRRLKDELKGEKNAS